MLPSANLKGYGIAQLLRGGEGEQTTPLEELLRQVLDRNCWLIQVSTVADAVALANQLAPEHCEVMTRRAAEASPDGGPPMASMTIPATASGATLCG